MVKRKAARQVQRDGIGRRSKGVVSPAGAAALEGAQENDQLILLCGAQVVEIVRYRLRFVAVTLNGVEKGDGAAVMQQLRARADSPKRRRAHFLSGFLATRLHDVIASADVVQQEVAIRMDNLIAQRSGHGEGACSDRGSRWCCGYRRDMANVAADVVKQICARDTVPGTS